MLIIDHEFSDGVTRKVSTFASTATLRLIEEAITDRRLAAVHAEAPDNAILKIRIRTEAPSLVELLQSLRSFEGMVNGLACCIRAANPDLTHEQAMAFLPGLEDVKALAAKVMPTTAAPIAAAEAADALGTTIAGIGLGQPAAIDDTLNKLGSAASGFVSEFAAKTNS